MKQGKSLEDLLQEVIRRANAKKDMVVNTKNLQLNAIDDGVKLNVAGKFDFKVNGIAHDQIGTHTEIPSKYYDKMLKEAPDLLATNVNEWFRKYPVDRMIRTLDGTNRAFLSNRYRALENEDLAEVVVPVLLELDLAIMSSEITDKRLYIKAVDKKVERELKAVGGKFGDGRHNIVRVLAPAITISNSEVGMGSTAVLGGVYDGFCSNLASFGERSAKRYHVGGKHEIVGDDVFALLSDDTRKLTNQATLAQIRDVVKAAFNEAHFNSLCDKIAETATHKIEGDPVEVVNLTTKKFGLGEADGKSILRHLIEGGDLSRFGLYNAVTRAAQDVDDYDKATQMERQGAQIIELPASEWKVLAKAA